MGRPVKKTSSKPLAKAKGRDAGKKAKAPLSKAALKREKQAEKRDGNRYLKYMLEVYTKDELKPVEEEDMDTEKEGDGEGGAADGSSQGADGAGDASKKNEILLCIKENCKRKRGGRSGPCIKDFCFLCCHESRNEPGSAYCPGHYAMSVQKDTEDRYIKEGLNLVKPKKTKFYHYEEKFTNYNQTVTVWCSKDFFLNREFSGDSMADVERNKRNKDLFRRRQGLGTKGTASSSSAASSSSSSSSSSSKVAAHDPSESWQQARDAHAKVSKTKFEGVLEKFRTKSGKNKDSTAYILK